MKSITIHHPETPLDTSCREKNFLDLFGAWSREEHRSRCLTPPPSYATTTISRRSSGSKSGSLAALEFILVGEMVLDGKVIFKTVRPQKYVLTSLRIRENVEVSRLFLSGWGTQPVMQGE